ncbi:MAG: sigma 54-interacting transcriptional regulator [Methylotetracoccus sp.]
MKVDVHVIAATNVRLLDAVEQGRFRRDLYYRLNGAQLRLPLRERSGKRELIRHILTRECELAGCRKSTLAPK